MITLNSCTPKEQNDKTLTLTVELKDKGVSFYNLFEKIELIPLELNENSFIKQITNMHLINDTLYVLDREVRSLTMFDGSSGKHLNTIMKVGQGPGEYTHVYDAIIDSVQQEIKLLSPFNFINTYDLSGRFIKKDNLPFPENSASAHFRNFDDSTYLFWINSTPDLNIGNMVLISKKTHQIINSFWRNKGLEDSFVVSPFWTYNNKTYFSISITNNVYQITSEGYDIAYKWDFDKYDIDKFREKEVVPVELKHRSERMMELIQQMMNSDKLYRFNSRHENNSYYYAQIVFKNEKSLAPHIFYNKASGESHYFFKTTEGLSFITYLFADNYMIAELLTDDLETLLSSNLLNETERSKLNMRKDDDNPVLVKLYFKKM
ncbi:MAG TPA: 6-bladed beta-propeller [Fermentimonas caenicola]|nr:6-bladed beta-propeller [Fermentimonas caenicola]